MTLRKISVDDIIGSNAEYKGFALIKDNVIAILSVCEGHNTKESRIQIIDMEKNKLLAEIIISEEVLKNIKSDGEYFTIISSSYQNVYVIDAKTYQLVNMIDITKCIELCVYEWKVNDWENGKYNNLSFELDIKNGIIYFLRHSGIYRINCLETEITKVFDGASYQSFYDQLNKFTSFLVGDNEDFYILSVYVDEEAATTMWHYTKK